jgi:fumarate reductase subunit D
MAKSNKPLIWGAFAAGGTVTAFVLPALVVLSLLPAFGFVPTLLSYDALYSFAGHWLGKTVIFALLFLALWHAAHRLRITLHDLGVRADSLVAGAVYSGAAAGSLATLYFLLRL